jgi:hypothetical protein
VLAFSNVPRQVPSFSEAVGITTTQSVVSVKTVSEIVLLYLVREIQISREVIMLYRTPGYGVRLEMMADAVHQWILASLYQGNVDMSND